MDNLDQDQQKKSRAAKVWTIIITTLLVLYLGLVIFVNADTCREGGYYKAGAANCPIEFEILNGSQAITTCANPTVFFGFPSTNDTFYNRTTATEITGTGQYWVYAPNTTENQFGETITGIQSVFFNCTLGGTTYPKGGRIEFVTLLPQERFENLSLNQQFIIDNLTLDINQNEVLLNALLANRSTDDIYNELIGVRDNATLTLQTLQGMDANLSENFTTIYTRLEEINYSATMALFNITDEIIPKINILLIGIDSVNINITTLRVEMGSNFSYIAAGIDSVNINLSTIRTELGLNFTDLEDKIAVNFSSLNESLSVLNASLTYTFDVFNESLTVINQSLTSIEEDTNLILLNLSDSQTLDASRFDSIDENLTLIYNDTRYISDQINCTGVAQTSQQMCGYLINITNLAVIIDVTTEEIQSTLGIVSNQEANNLLAELSWIRHDPVFGLDEKDDIRFFFTVKDGKGTTKALDGSLVSIFTKDSDTLIANISNNERLASLGLQEGHYQYTVDNDVGEGFYRVRVRAETVNTTTYIWSSFSVVNKTALQQIEESTGILKTIQDWLSSLQESINNIGERLKGALTTLFTS